MADWKADKQVPSCAARLGLLAGLAGCGRTRRMGKFSTDGNVAALQTRAGRGGRAVRQEVANA